MKISSGPDLSLPSVDLAVLCSASMKNYSLSHVSFNFLLSKTPFLLYHCTVAAFNRKHEQDL